MQFLRIGYFLSLIALTGLGKGACGAKRLPYRPPLRPFKPEGPQMLQSEADRGLLEQCKEDYRDVQLDHFSWVGTMHAFNTISCNNLPLALDEDT